MRHFYQHDVKLLQNLSVTGRTKKGAERKETISDENRNIIERMFSQRLEAIGMNPADKNTRKKRLNSLLKTAITNMIQKATKKKPKTMDDKTETDHEV